MDLHILQVSDLDKIDADEEIWIVGFFVDPEGDIDVFAFQFRSLRNQMPSKLKRIQSHRSQSKRNRPCWNSESNFFTSRPRRHRNRQKRSQFSSLSAQSEKAVFVVRQQTLVKIVRFPFGSDKNSMDAYELFEGNLDAKELQDFAMEANPIHPMKLDSSNIAHFMSIQNEYATPRPKALKNKISFSECFLGGTVFFL